MKIPGAAPSYDTISPREATAFRAWGTLFSTMRLDGPTLRDGGRFWFAEFLAAANSPGLERLRLDRLHELHAVIDSLRSQHESAPRHDSPTARERYHP